MPIDENQINEVLGNAPGHESAPEGLPTPAAEEPQLFEYSARGQTVKEDLGTILKRASMGYDYAQNMESFKKEKDQFSQSISEREARINEVESRWKPYDEYARANPTWEEHVRTQWDNRQQQGFEQSQPSSTVLPPEVQGQFEKMNAFIENYNRAEEDAHLNREIESVKSKHTNIDFTTTDPNTGKSLEFKVLEHAKQNGINNFRAAFYDFYHDQLVIQAQEQAKQGLVQTIQKDHKEGFIGESPTPFLGQPQQQKSLSDMSWDEVMKEAAKDNGLQYY